MPTAALSALAMLRGGFDLQTILIVVLVLTVSLSFHEFMHGYVAYRLGDDTAALAGRLTMNPMSHIDPIGALMFILVGFGYARPVPYNPTRFTRTRSMKFGSMLVGLAGPMANLVLSFLAIVLLFSTQTVARLASVRNGNPVYDLLTGLFIFLYQANINLMVFNLLPIPPLDGSKVFGSLLPNELYYRYLNLQRYSGIFMFILIMFGRNILGSVLEVIRTPFDYVLLTPMQMLFRALWRLLGIA